MITDENKKKQPVVTPATDEWNDTEREVGGAFKQATATNDNTIKAAEVRETPSSIVKGKVDKPTAVDAEDDTNKTILDNFLKQQEALNKEKEQIDSQNPNTPEAIKKRNRRALIASIADGLSALSGMYFATKGAPTTSNVVPGITEGIAKQNTADRNTYLELLQNWRKRNNELINNYATYQATAEKNRIAAANASLEVEREARLLAKQDWQKTYQKTYLELKAKKIDDDSAKWKAKIAADEKEAESLDRYRKELAAIGRAKVDRSGQGKSRQGKSGQGTKIIYMRRGKGGKWVINNEINNGNK